MKGAEPREYHRHSSIVFRKTSEAFGGLSNMAPGFPLVVNGHPILTSEALYQACRFPHLPEVQQLILDQASPMTAKMVAKPHRAHSRPDWDALRVQIMRWCLRVKLAQNWGAFSVLLLSTGENPIVEESHRDDFWGARPDDPETLIGHNVLGRLLMELRQHIREGAPPDLLVVPPLEIPDFLLLKKPIGSVVGHESCGGPGPTHLGAEVRRSARLPTLPPHLDGRQSTGEIDPAIMSSPKSEVVEVSAPGGTEMKVADFQRLFDMRAPNIMWLLGAGASAAAGIPTAYDMIWEFKRTLYCTAQKISIRACQDLGDLNLRKRLQAHLDSLGVHPPENSEMEYSHYFEATYPAEEDRRRYIERKISGAKPSIGHQALAALMKTGHIRSVWTTNFDRMIEDAVNPMFGTSSSTIVATLDTPKLALQAMNEGRWPLLTKLHGDFQSRALKNTSDELRAQDVELRRALVESCKRFGLAVVGYSGRDISIMDALEEAIADGEGYPSGLFWFCRGDYVLPRVKRLIERAKAFGVQAELISVETFDELMSDLLLLVRDLPPEVAAQFNNRSRYVSDAPLPLSIGSFPVVRMNGIPVLSWPTVCRRVSCSIGGTRDVRTTVQNSGSDAIAVRSRAGVLGFGSDESFRKAFDSYGISEFDLYSIEPARLNTDASERGLLYDALARALVRQRPLRVEWRSEGPMAYVDSTRETDPVLALLKHATKTISGLVPGTNVKWAEALSLQLEYRLNRLWLVLEPGLWLSKSPLGSPESEAAKKFARERQAKRYNTVWNSVLDAWISVLMGSDDGGKLSSFGVAECIDASFTLCRTTGFSRRGG